jgi:hypothetical protein
MTRLSFLTAFLVFALLIPGTTVDAKKHKHRESWQLQIFPDGIHADIQLVACGGKTDTPHKSKHSGGTRVNVLARTKCPAAYPQIYVYSSHYHSHDGRLDLLAQGPAFGNKEGRTMAEVSVNTPCPGRNRNYKAESYHFVQFPSGSYGSGATSNSGDVNC